MTEHVTGSSGGGRRYHSPRRLEQAVATRRAVLDAARDLFVDKGYLATTVADVARQARVAVDTVYATVGRKPALLREVVETAISGTDRAVPAEQRDYVARARAAPTLRGKIEAYVAGLVEIQPRLAPVYLALRDAATTDADSAALWSEISGRRAANMRRFAADLRATGELRPDLSDDQVADIVWSMNGPEYWTLLVVDRGWQPDRFGALLVDTWIRLLGTGQPPTVDRARHTSGPAGVEGA
jgi:AcrR family transcriptional regulator